MKTAIELKELSEILSYNKDTGEFTYKHDRCRGVKKGDIAGYYDKDGYLMVSLLGTTKKLHRVAWLFINKSYPEGQIDHINRARDDNRIINLRDVTASENAQNRSISISNKSGFTGIYWHKEKKKWHARITNKGVVTNIGYFKDLELASKARKEHEIKNNFNKNHGV